MLPLPSLEVINEYHQYAEYVLCTKQIKSFMVWIAGTPYLNSENSVEFNMPWAVVIFFFKSLCFWHTRKFNSSTISQSVWSEIRTLFCSEHCLKFQRQCFYEAWPQHKGGVVQSTASLKSFVIKYDPFHDPIVLSLLNTQGRRGHFGLNGTRSLVKQSRIHTVVMCDLSDWQTTKPKKQSKEKNTFLIFNRT